MSWGYNSADSKSNELLKIPFTHAWNCTIVLIKLQTNSSVGSSDVNVFLFVVIVVADDLVNVFYRSEFLANSEIIRKKCAVHIDSGKNVLININHTKRLGWMKIWFCRDWKCLQRRWLFIRITIFRVFQLKSINFSIWTDLLANEAGF